MVTAEYTSTGMRNRGLTPYSEALVSSLRRQNPSKEFSLEYPDGLFLSEGSPGGGYSSCAEVFILEESRGFNLFRRWFPKKQRIASLSHRYGDPAEANFTTIRSYDERLLPPSTIEMIARQVEN